MTLWLAAERGLDRVCGPAANPLRQLGAVAAFAFALLAASGALLYVLLDTSADGAWASIERLAVVPLGLGDLLRGLHRHAADLLVVALVLHLLREWLHGHYVRVHRFAWLTGVPLVGFVFAAGIGGFWLNWDQLGQYSALATAEWLDALPLLGAPMARNFLGVASVGDRLFSLFLFVHVGVSLLMAFGLWFHVQRLGRPVLWPTRALVLALLAMLALVAVLAPVRSHAPAALARVPAELRLDWFLLFLHPLGEALTLPGLWVLVAAVAALLFGLPLWRRAQPAAPVAVVDAANCNGCRRCEDDCPYAAVTMVPHPNQRIGRHLAVVDSTMCAGCGICAGACPSSTPFRGAAQLVTGIDMPQRPVSVLRAELRAALAACTAPAPIVVFGCGQGARLATVAAPDVLTIGLICTGQLPPSFVEYALRDGAAGVLVAACREGGCAFRQGERWAAQRLLGQREPHLRDGVPADRWAMASAGAGDEAALAQAVRQLRQRLNALDDAADNYPIAAAPAAPPAAVAPFPSPPP
ncbi:MAG: hydrogenase iron-sulfur subunit [Aquabacterium sp.]